MANQLGFKWWIGSDGNIWANVEGKGVGNYGNASNGAGLASLAGTIGGNSQTIGANQIADPNRPSSGGSASDLAAVQVLKGAGSSTNKTADYDPNKTNRTSSTTTSAAQAATNRNMINFYNDMIGSKNDAINKLTGNLQNEMDRINGEYNTYRNEQQSAYNKAKSEYDNNSTQNKQSLVTNRNTITDNASQGLRGLMRVLGAMGAGGGSVARYNAPEAVKDQADKENANAGLTYAQNQQNLDTDWGNYQNDFENDKKKLEDWKTGQVKSAEQNIEKERVSLLEQLAELYGNRATYGEGVGNNISDIRGRINAANQRIQDLGKYSAPAYNGITANYTAPTLSSYDTGQADLTTTVNDAGDSGNTSLLTVLRQLNKKKQTTPYNYGTEE